MALQGELADLRQQGALPPSRGRIVAAAAAWSGEEAAVGRRSLAFREWNTWWISFWLLGAIGMIYYT